MRHFRMPSILTKSPLTCYTHNMGFQKSQDKSSILWVLDRLSIEVNSPHNDGWTAWGVKQDLYQIKFKLDYILENSPTFAGEMEFLNEHAKQKVWKQLKQV